MAYRVKAAGASVFVGDDVAVAKLRAAQRSGECGDVGVVMQAAGNRTPGETSYEEELAKVAEDAVYQGKKTRWDEEAMVYFTSGTTGFPKLVKHNHVSYPLGELQDGHNTRRQYTNGGKAHCLTGSLWLGLKAGSIYWNLSEQG